MPKQKSTHQPDKVLSRKVTKPLPVKLTEYEITSYGRDLARAYSERERISGELDSIKQDYKGKIAEQDATIGKLSGRVNSGIETRDIECREEKNWTKATVTVTRLDDMEVIESRPMREDEKQQEMSEVVGTISFAEGAEK